jgi:hypothetical protein
VIFLAPKPKAVISIWYGNFFDVLKINFPSTSLIVPELSPTTLILAPGMG